MAQIDFLEWISKGAITIENIERDDLDRIKSLMVKYQDLPMDFADACLVFLGEKLNILEIATIDRDFSIYRLKGNKKFKIVLQ
jgi:predicted nucleic acid-binding protein